MCNIYSAHMSYNVTSKCYKSDANEKNTIDAIDGGP